jgi:predicted amidohydrolase YtcJ
LRDVLQAYTLGSAYAQLAEHQMGSIELGKLADLIIWDSDLFALPVDQVQHARVSQTIVNGKVVYSSSDETRTSK